MGTINNFEDLDIWQKSRVLCQQIDKYCLKNSKFYQHDKFQIDRASASIMDNIAEELKGKEIKNFQIFWECLKVQQVRFALNL